MGEFADTDLVEPFGRPRLPDLAPAPMSAVEGRPLFADFVAALLALLVTCNARGLVAEISNVRGLVVLIFKHFACMSYFKSAKP